MKVTVPTGGDLGDSFAVTKATQVIAEEIVLKQYKGEGEGSDSDRLVR